MNERQQSTKSSQQEQGQGSILVVDDDRHVRQMIRWVLEEEGFSVQSAADGQEALEKIYMQRPALIILDMSLPLLGGDEVAAQVRSHYDGEVPIVLITADGHAEEKSRKVGAIAYLRKPFDIDDLIQIVQRALEGYA